MIPTCESVSTWNRRRFLRATGLGGVAIAAAAVGHAQPGIDAPTDLVTPDTQAVIQRGIAYLARVQSPQGFWDDGQGPNIAVTGLAALALMAAGNQPGRGAFGRNVSRALDYCLTRGHGTPAGFLHGGDEAQGQSQMYEHGFGTLFLAELSGMLPTSERQMRLRDKLEQAVGVIFRSQSSKEGGWRYRAEPGESDVSVTVAQLMALRAARNAGVAVPKSIVDSAVDYIRACQLPEGGFRYIKGVDTGGASFARSAAAVVGLYCAGLYDDPAIARGLRYLKQFQPNNRGQRDPRVERYYYYGHYYAALAMWTAGGDTWNTWFTAVRNDLISRARTGPSGVWVDFGHGSAYATAMALIILQLPNNYLPILQK
ncbi:terpene cyclase/mutase family protein [soil metagenome]